MRLIKAPFFEIGPKNYLYGEDVFSLALAADAAAEKYQVDVIFTCPYTEIRRVAEHTSFIHVFAPHMDVLNPGRGLADVLPEALKAAGAEGVMLNHCEKPLPLAVLENTIKRARQLGLMTIVCGNSMSEIRALAQLHPHIIVAEPSELIGTGITSDIEYVRETMQAVHDINTGIYVLQGAGIKDGEDVYRMIISGAQGTGSSSGIACAKEPMQMIDEMVAAVRRAWDQRNM